MRFSIIFVGVLFSCCGVVHRRTTLLVELYLEARKVRQTGVESHCNASTERVDKSVDGRNFE